MAIGDIQLTRQTGINPSKVDERDRVREEMDQLIKQAQNAGRQAAFEAALEPGPDIGAADQSEIEELKQRVLELESRVAGQDGTISELESWIVQLQYWQQEFDVTRYISAGRRVSFGGTDGKVSINVNRGYIELFELYDVWDDQFKVRGVTAKTGGAWIAGAYKTIADGAGMTWDSDGFWQSDAISATNYVWLELDRSNGTVSIIMGTTLPDGTADEYDYTEIVPLWKVPYDSTNSLITSGEVESLRWAARVPGMA